MKKLEDSLSSIASYLEGNCSDLSPSSVQVNPETIIIEDRNPFDTPTQMECAFARTPHITRFPFWETPDIPGAIEPLSFFEPWPLSPWLQPTHPEWL